MRTYLIIIHTYIHNIHIKSINVYLQNRLFPKSVLSCYFDHEKVMKNIVKFDYLTRNAHKHKHFKNGKFPINLFNVYKSNIFRF